MSDATTSDSRPVSLSDRVQSLRLPDRPGSGGGRLPWVLCAVFFTSTLAFGFQAFKNRPAEGEGKPETAPRPDDRTADSGDVVLESKGYIIPAHQIQVSPQVGGKVESLYITEGQRVDKGQILAQLEVVEYETDYKRAVARLAAARQNWELLKANYPSEVARSRHDLDEATADLSDARDRLDRAQRLDINTQSKEELIRLRNLTKMAEARLRRRQEEVSLAKLASWKVQAAQAEREAAQAELDKAVWRLDNCTVLAPVSGTILTKKAEESNLVNPSAFSNGLSASLCEMADLSDLEVDLTIQERDIAHIVVGQKCTVVPEAFQNNKAFRARHPTGYDGEVSRLMPIADRAKGAIPVRVKVVVPREEEGVYLKPDMGVIVSFKKVPEKGN